MNQLPIRERIVQQAVPIPDILQLPVRIEIALPRFREVCAVGRDKGGRISLGGGDRADLAHAYLLG